MKKNKKVKMTFNIDPKVRRQIKNYVEDLGYKSESAFCCEACGQALYMEINETVVRNRRSIKRKSVPT